MFQHIMFKRKMNRQPMQERMNRLKDYTGLPDVEIERARQLDQSVEILNQILARGTRSDSIFLLRQVLKERAAKNTRKSFLPGF